jgi:hypothetical protein
MPSIITSFGVINGAGHLTTKNPLLFTKQETPNTKQVSASVHGRPELQIRPYIADDDLSPSQDHTTGIYRPLLGSGSFQLLEILSGANDAVEVKLHVCSLRKNAMAYEALSYTWGADMSSQDVTIWVEANGRYHKTNVTRNLHSALLGLRRPDCSRMVWADAICINQDDAIEKNQQVKMMKTIYSEACRVVIWIGDDSGFGGFYRGQAFPSVCSIVNDWLTLNNEKEVEATFSEQLINGKSITHPDMCRRGFDSQSQGDRQEYYRRRFFALKLFEQTVHSSLGDSGVRSC